MKTKKQYGWMLRLLSVVFLLAGLTACGSSEGSVDEKEPEKPKPEVPVADGDWQVVPATGGTITKDDITISFPSGTFSEDTKVAVTETKADKNARSKFYQVTLPEIGTNKDFTIKLKCEGSIDNVYARVKTPGYSKHTGKTADMYMLLEPTKVNDELNFSIPEAKTDGKEKPFLTIGLLERGYLHNNARTRSLIPYWINTDCDLDSLTKHWDRYQSIIKIAERCLPTCYQILEDTLHFKFPEGQGQIEYTFTTNRDNHEGSWGVFTPCWYFPSWSCVYLNEGRFLEYLNAPNNDMLNALKSTLLHESLHAYTYFSYDPRYGFDVNYSGYYGDDWAQFDEAVGCWVEKFIGAKTTSENTIENQYLFFHEFRPHERNATTCRDHGYGMATFVEFIARKIGNLGIVGIFKEWKRLGSMPVTVPFFETIKAFLRDNNVAFFDTKSFYDYAFSVMNNKFDPLINIEKTISLKDITDNGYVDLKDKTLALQDNVYNYGVLVQKVRVPADFQKMYADSTLVISQNEKGVLTRVYYQESNDLKEIGQSEIGKPMSISVKELCKKFGFDIKDAKIKPIYLATTRVENKDDYSGLPSDITIEIQGEEDKNTSAKVEPDKVEFDAMGGTNNEVKIIKGSYKNCGVDDVQAPDSKWLSAKGTSDGAVTIEAKPNMSFEGRKGEVKCWVSNKENPQPGEKKYLTVEVIQNGVTGVDWNPKELKFPASGGSEKISFEFGGFTRFGAQVRKEGQGWCGVAAANGKLTITVQPNETKEPRECIVDAYVTNSQNPTDEDKLLMPITVYQEGVKETKPSSLKIKSIVLSVSYNDGSERSFMVDWNKKEGTIQAEKLNGGSTHVTCTNNTGYNKSTLSFDIDNESLISSKKATFSNFKSEGKEYYMSKISNEWNIATKSTSDYSYYTDSFGEKSCGLHWKQGEFTTFEHSQTNNSITLSDSKLSELKATVSIFFEEPPQ